MSSGVLPCVEIAHNRGDVGDRLPFAYNVGKGDRERDPYSDRKG